MSQVQATLDHLFRREFGRIVGYLTRFLGPDRLDLAENVVQEALLKAVQVWPVQGIPEKPSAWILTVAKNAALDFIRSQRNLEFDSDIIDALDESVSQSSGPDVIFENEMKDDQLKLMFICCHPSLARESRIALTLKTVCGFSVREIARAFLAKEETIAQRIVRAKQRIADQGLQFEVPEPNEIKQRVDSVLDVVYLMFNEGYSATQGDSVIRLDLCMEAIYRAQCLTDHPLCSSPKVFALLALMHFQTSRFDSRLDSNGELLLLEEQDRKVWDKGHIEQGLKYLELSAEGEDLTEFHLQAGIASCHALAPTFDQTNWEQIVGYYDLLAMKESSPVVMLNRAVAMAMARGPEVGLVEIEKLKAHPVFKNYYLLPASMAELHRRNGNLITAKKFYEQALDLVGNEPERRLLLKRMKSCRI